MLAIVAYSFAFGCVGVGLAGVTISVWAAVEACRQWGDRSAR